MHINTRHTSRFTVVGNHLAQHREMSLMAIGLATHIQSLPAGAKIGVKTLTERFPESEARIAAALRELEAHGYLRRTRERLSNGRVVTRTCSYNQPKRPSRAHPTVTVTSTAPAPAPEPETVPAPAPAPAPAPRAVTPPPAPLPQPDAPRPQLLRAATALLSELHRHAPQITLTAQDITLLTPTVATWFERGSTVTALRHTLIDDLPQPLKHPAKLIRHRLTALLPPPPLPGGHTVPLQNCDRCDRAFRSSAPGDCRECAADRHRLPPVPHRAEHTRGGGGENPTPPRGGRGGEKVGGGGRINKISGPPQHHGR
ncbi:helix-turn-helix domain-containing protein [Streptomyces sp. NPDC059218]|uniref:helix-turn-helix domain-containing protein n=1 Tax=Streptomyces sp. NPDC059218 TaxID=3346773 RepID=UPI0036C60ED3